MKGEYITLEYTVGEWRQLWSFAYCIGGTLGEAVEAIVGRQTRCFDSKQWRFLRDSVQVRLHKDYVTMLRDCCQQYIQQENATIEGKKSAEAMMNSLNERLSS